jgi:hypothetical protein
MSESKKQCKNCKWYWDCKGKEVCEEYELEFSYNERLEEEQFKKEYRKYIYENTINV